MEKAAKQLSGVHSPKDEAARLPNRSSEGVFEQHKVKYLQARPLAWCTPPFNQQRPNEHDFSQKPQWKLVLCPPLGAQVCSATPPSQEDTAAGLGRLSVSRGRENGAQMEACHEKCLRVHHFHRDGNKPLVTALPLLLTTSFAVLMSANSEARG